MEITSEQQEKIAAIGKKYKLKLVLLHGSYVTGKEHSGSDLDIAFLGEIKPSYKEELNIFRELADVFGNNEKRELDVKTLHGVDPLFMNEVARDSQLLYGNRTDYDEFCSRAFIYYHDSKDLRELEQLLSRRQLDKLKKEYA